MVTNLVQACFQLYHSSKILMDTSIYNICILTGKNMKLLFIPKSLGQHHYLLCTRHKYTTLPTKLKS